MRKISLKPDVEDSIDKVCEFIESRNLPGSSNKWAGEILDFIIEHAILNITYPLCNNKRLAKRKLSCIIFKNKWVVAFKATKKTFTVYKIINGSKLR